MVVINVVHLVMSIVKCVLIQNVQFVKVVILYMKILVKCNVEIIKLFMQKYVKIIIWYLMMDVLIVNSLVH
jgi:hypothetical protein